MFSTVLVLVGLFRWLLTLSIVQTIWLNMGDLFDFYFVVSGFMSLSAISSAEKKAHKFHSKIVYYSYYIISERERSHTQFTLPSINWKYTFWHFHCWIVTKTFAIWLFENILHYVLWVFWLIQLNALSYGYWILNTGYAHMPTAKLQMYGKFMIIIISISKYCYSYRIIILKSTINSIIVCGIWSARAFK